MKILTRASAGALAGVLFLGGFAPTAAIAAPVADTPQAASVTTVTADQKKELANTLEVLFEEVMTVDSTGVVTYNEDKATKLLGAEKAAALGEQVRAGQAQRNATGATTLSMANATASGDSFVDCMIENSVIGLVTGVASGYFGELLREKRWDELAEKMMPKLIKAGVTGGVVGVAAGLAASAVQCTWFND